MQQYSRYYDGKLHVVFCDVGQGDAIFIRTPTNKNILIDGGPDRKVLSCLSQHMPFWERQIDLLILTHPHADHLLGIFFVLDRYITKSFATERLSNKTQAFTDLLQTIEKKKIPQQIVWAGDSWKIGKDVVISIDAPTEEFVQRTSPGGTIGESGEFASLITRVSYGAFSVLLTGDSQSEGLREVIAVRNEPVTVLQVPHHGSATGLTPEIVKALQPHLAVISVGKNRYGHPKPVTVQLLSSFEVPMVRTDKVRDIEIVSDGKQWWKMANN